MIATRKIKDVGESTLMVILIVLVIIILALFILGR